MRFDWLLTFRSVTYAQSGERTLRKIGINCLLQRTPRDLTDRGCGYCLRIRGVDALAAVELLRDRGVSFVKVYAMGNDGRMEEREI